MKLEEIFESTAAFDDYCNDIKCFLQKSGEVSVRNLVAHWEDKYTKGTREQKEILEHLFAIMINYSSELETQCNELREFMRDKIPEHYHNINSWSDNNETDIIIFNPLERQINGMPIFEHDSIADNVFNYVSQIRDYTRKLYTYLILYINKLTIHMQYTKSHILTLELSRRDIHQNTLHPLDCIIQFRMDEFMNLKKEYDKFNSQLFEINIDNNYMVSCGYSCENHIKMNYFKTFYERQYLAHYSVSTY